MVDLVSVDPLTGIVYLTLIEERGWGEAGKLLADLPDKLNTYLEYVASGQLSSAYPDLAGSSVAFRVHCLHELTAPERGGPHRLPLTCR